MRTAYHLRGPGGKGTTASAVTVSEVTHDLQGAARKKAAGPLTELGPLRSRKRRELGCYKLQQSYLKLEKLCSSAKLVG